MKLTKYALLIAVIVVSMICQSCGGNSNTSGTLTITTIPKSVGAGSSFDVVVTYTNTNSTTNSGTLQGVPVSVSTNSASVSSGTASTGQTGIATINLTTMNNISADQTVVVTAQAGGLTQSASFTLMANQLTLGVLSSAADTFPAGTLGTIAPSGTFITYTDGNGNPIPNQPISLRVIVLEGGTGTWTATGTGFALNQPITVTTDSHGIVDFATFNVSSIVPASGNSTVVVVQFQAVANVAPGVAPGAPGTPGNITTDSSSFVFTFTGQ